MPDFEWVTPGPTVSLLTRYGGATSLALRDPTCLRFREPGLEGVIPYRETLGCRVGLGDPVCGDDDLEVLADAFRIAGSAAKKRIVFAGASEVFAARCIERGYAAIEWGEEVILDPNADRLSGAAGRLLRKKLRRAEREGVSLHEHRRRGDAGIEDRLDEAARAWLAARRGPQAFIVPIDRFEPFPWRRVFYAAHGVQVVGALTMVQVEGSTGWAIEHIVYRPDAPIGTSEALVVRALEVIGAEGASYVTFGPAPLPRLGRMVGVGRIAAAWARSVFDTAERVFDIGSILRFRQKFGPARTAPSYLLFHPRVGVLSTLGLVRAFSAH